MAGPVALAPRGTSIIRFAKALAMARSDLPSAAEYAAHHWGLTAAPTRFLKAASAAGTTVPANWGAELADYQSATSEFFGLIAQRSIPGRMPLRRVPFNVRLLSLTSPATAGWVKQARPKPATEMGFAGPEAIQPRKVASIAILTAELLRSASPAAEDWVRRSLIDAVTLALNSSFIDPANAGVADLEPASITFGAPTVPASGSWPTDLAALLAIFTGDIETAVFVLNGRTATLLTGPDQPALSTRGGELSGIPVVTDPSVPEGTIVLADGSRIAYAEDNLTIDTSQQANLETSDAPSGTASFSLWQRNCSAILTEQAANWRVMQPGAIAVLTGVGGP